MGSILTAIRKNRMVKIVDVMAKGKSSDYPLRPGGEIIARKDEDFDIRSEGWYSATVRLWPKPKSQIESQCFQKRTPCCSSISRDSGFDEPDLIF